MWKFIPKRAFIDYMNTTAPTTDINPIPKALTVPEKLARAVGVAAAVVEAPVVIAVASGSEGPYPTVGVYVILHGEIGSSPGSANNLESDRRRAYGRQTKWDVARYVS